MDFRFVTADLRRLDTLRAEALAVPFFEDDRPLVGVLGLVDWRTCGLLSRLVTRGRLRGRRGERLLVAARPKLSFEKLFVFGLGPRGEFDEAVFEEGVRAMADVLGRARVRACVCALPGRPEGLVAPARAMELFLRTLGESTELDELTLVEDADAPREMKPVVERERRRARAVQ
jgi:hypothetical protein